MRAQTPFIDGLLKRINGIDWRAVCPIFAPPFWVNLEHSSAAQKARPVSL